MGNSLSRPDPAPVATGRLTKRAGLIRVLGIALVALLGLGVSPSTAHAQVILAGCRGGDFGDDCSLRELFAGGSIQTGDKVFEDWRLNFNSKVRDSTSIPSVGPEDIKVLPIENGLDYFSSGIIVSTKRDPNPLPGPAPQLLRERLIFSFFYAVQVTTDLVSIVGNELRIPGLGNAEVEGFGFVKIEEFIQEKRKFVVSDPLGGGNIRRDSVELEPTNLEIVRTDIDLMSGLRLEEKSQLMRFEQTFKQKSEKEPEPSPTPEPTPEPQMVNNFVTFNPIQSTFNTTSDTTGCPSGFVGKFSFDARLTNINEDSSLSDLVVEVASLTNGNLLQNADGGPGGVGATLTVPEEVGFSDGVLEPEETVDVPFVICLKNRNRFSLFVDVLGVFLADFGDAPESDETIFPGIGITANYPSRLASGGPFHTIFGDVWLGPHPETTTAEPDAILPNNDDYRNPPFDIDDQGPIVLCIGAACDSGFITSGLPGNAGATFGPPPGAVDDCYEAFWIFRVSVGAGAPSVPRFANVVVDPFLCTDPTAGVYGDPATEWVVINQPVTASPGGSQLMTTLPFEVFVDVDVNNNGIIEDFNGDGILDDWALPPFWSRFTVSRTSIDPAQFAPNGWDGSGPPGGFTFGETQDQLVVGDPPAEPSPSPTPTPEPTPEPTPGDF